MYIPTPTIICLAIPCTTLSFKPVSETVNIHDLPPKRQRYIRARMSNIAKSKRNAALEAGYSQSVAQKACVLETPDVKAVFRQMIQSRIGSAKLADRLAEGLDAEKTEFFSKDGVVMDQRNTVAWAERRAYLELAAQYGGYVSKDEDRNVNLHVMLSPPVDDDPSPVQVQVQDQVIDVASKPV